MCAVESSIVRIPQSEQSACSDSLLYCVEENQYQNLQKFLSLLELGIVKILNMDDS